MKRARHNKRRLPPLRRLGRSNRLFPRKLKLTREGKLLVVLALGVGVGAVNTGNNLLYLVLGLMLSLIVTSGILSELTLRKLTADLTIPPHAFARRPHLVRVAVTNAKRLFGSFSVNVSLVSVDDDERVTQRPAYVLHLHRAEAGAANLELRFAERGRYRFAGVRVATSYPFGFFLKSRIVPLDQDVVVYPAIVPVAALALSGLRMDGATLRPKAGRGDDYYALRELRTGDDLRDIYWKVSAKVGELVVREYEEPVRRRVTLLFPNVSPDETRETLADLEATIEVAASLAAMLTEGGSEVGLVTADRAISPDSGARHLHVLLHHLALLQLYVASEDKAARLPASSGGVRILVRHARQRAVPLTGATGVDLVHEVRGRPASRDDAPTERLRQQIVAAVGGGEGA